MISFLWRLIFSLPYFYLCWRCMHEYFAHMRGDGCARPTSPPECNTWVRLICEASLKCLARQARQTATTAPRAAILLNSEGRRHGRPVRKDYPTPALMMHEYHPFTSPTWKTHVRCASHVRGQVLGNDRTGRGRGTPPVTPAMTTEQRGVRIVPG